MPAALRVILTESEEMTLSELRIASSVPYRVRDRAHMLLLNAEGWTAPVLAEMFKCHEHTVRSTIKRWKNEGLYGLWEKEGRGTKPKWESADLDFLIECITHEGRTYNSRQLSVKLWEERGVKLSPSQIRRLLKKRAIAGSEPVIAT